MCLRPSHHGDHRYPCGTSMTDSETRLRESIRALLDVWIIERDAKCQKCLLGYGLGRFGCHFEDGPDESYSVGNCQAWPLSRRIQQIEASLNPILETTVESVAKGDSDGTGFK